jgi:hypothetical protein
MVGKQDTRGDAGGRLKCRVRGRVAGEGDSWAGEERVAETWRRQNEDSSSGSHSCERTAARSGKMSRKFEGIVVMRLGASMSEKIWKQFQAAVEKTCQALGIRQAIEERRESEGWTRNVRILSPTWFSSSMDAFQWAKEVACRIAERFRSREAVSSRKYCGVWIDFEEDVPEQKEERPSQGEFREFDEDPEEGDGQEGEEFV